MKKFPERLVSLRKENHVSQVELGNHISKTRSTISGYETEGKEPDITTLCMIANYFDVSVDYLVGASDKRGESTPVFANDNIRFKKQYETLPNDLRKVVDKSFESFYLLFSDDIQSKNPGRIVLCQKLLHSIQSLRANIRKCVESSDGQLSGSSVSDLMALQAELKNTVSAILDEMVQEDMKTNFDTRNGKKIASS